MAAAAAAAAVTEDDRRRPLHDTGIHLARAGASRPPSPGAPPPLPRSAPCRPSPASSPATTTPTAGRGSPSTPSSSPPPEIVTKKKNNKLIKKFKENVEEAKSLRRKVNAKEGEQRCSEATEGAVLDSSEMQPKIVTKKRNNKLTKKFKEKEAELLYTGIEGAVLDSSAMQTKSVSPSTAKRKNPEGKKKLPQAKRFKSPIAPLMVKSPGTRMLISPIQSAPKHGSSCSGKKRKLRSEIWNDFDPIYAGETLAEAKCKHCKQTFKVARDVGNSSCHRHLNSCEGKAKMEQMIDQMKSDCLDDPSLKDWNFKQDVSRQELVKLIVVHELPFSLVEYPKFRSFVSSLNPWFTHISRTTIRADCIATYEHGMMDFREKLKNMKCRVSLTADFWTSNQKMGYLCVTCHYIDENWKIHKRIIKFGLVETPHNGRNMFNAMLRTLQDWNLEHKVFAITLDNAAANHSFVSTLKENLVAKKLLHGQGKLLHNRCAAHVLNLIVQEGLEQISDAVSNIRESVKYIKSSQARKERFEKMIQDVGISCDKRPSLDVDTRWNSTYDMLNSTLPYARAFESLSREDSQYLHEPLPEEWAMSKKLCQILKKFHSATKVVSGSKYPTSSCYFHQIWEVKRVLESESSNSDPIIASMVYRMKQKLMKYWDLSFMTICIPVILDPRFKLGFLLFRLQKGFGDGASFYYSEVEKMFQKLFPEYSMEMGDLIPKNAHSVVDEANDDSMWADWGQQQNVQKMATESELDMYLKEETVPVGVDFDILQYWKMYSTKYPILAQMARDLLAVSASTVASESAFSTGDRVISDYRSRLTSQTVEALIYLQDWIRGDDSTHDNIAGNIFGDASDII
ncbi:hypothetical protein ACP70R_028406 [Stipagrostis hirtigluma subsp. patula]